MDEKYPEPQSTQRTQSSEVSATFALRSGNVLKPQRRTRITRIGRISTDPRASAQSVFHHVCSSLKNPASGTKVSAFITPKPCGFSTPRTRMPVGIRQGLRPLRTPVHVCQCAGIRVHAIDWRDSRRGHALQRRDSGRLNLRFPFP